MKGIHVEGRALAFVSYGVDRRCARENLRGIRVEYHGGRAVCVATDGGVIMPNRGRDPGGEHSYQIPEWAMPAVAEDAA